MFAIPHTIHGMHMGNKKTPSRHGYHAIHSHPKQSPVSTAVKTILSSRRGTGIDKLVQRHTAVHILIQHPWNEWKSRLWLPMVISTECNVDNVYLSGTPPEYSFTV